MLAENGARPKYVPPEDILQRNVEADYEAEISRRVEWAIEKIVDKDSIVTLVTEELREEMQLPDAADLIRKRFKERPTTTWKSIVDREHTTRGRQKEEAIETMVREEIVSLVTEEEED